MKLTMTGYKKNRKFVNIAYVQQESGPPFLKSIGHKKEDVV